MTKIIATLLSVTLMIGIMYSVRTNKSETNEPITVTVTEQQKVPATEPSTKKATEKAETTAPATEKEETTVPVTAKAETTFPTTETNAPETTAKPEKPTPQAPTTEALKVETKAPETTAVKQPPCTDTTPIAPETEAKTSKAESRPTEASKYSQLESEILQMINAHRKEAGVAPLEIDYTYYECGLIRAQECLEYWSHTRPDGRNFHSVYYDLGLSDGLKLMGENLAKNFSSTESIMEMLMNSPGHRENILYPEYNRVVICIVEVEGYDGLYAMSQLFIKKD